MIYLFIRIKVVQVYKQFSKLDVLHKMLDKKIKIINIYRFRIINFNLIRHLVDNFEFISRNNSFKLCIDIKNFVKLVKIK